VLQIQDPVIFDTWIRDPGWKKIQIQDPESGMNIPDLTFENFVSVFG
jgi:hypothetical protein